MPHGFTEIEWKINSQSAPGMELFEKNDKLNVLPLITHQTPDKSDHTKQCHHLHLSQFLTSQFDYIYTNTTVTL